MRDDFNIPVKRIIADRVGHRCSNPACRRGTRKADPVDENNALNLGIAAHITAAAPGGPRYNPNLTVEERKSATNGIWLCKRCASEIDLTPDAYSIETLKTWKTQSESAAARDVAATPDEIAEVIAIIEKTNRYIHEFIDSWSQQDPMRTWDFEEDFNTRSRKVISHGSSLQKAYDKDINPHVAEILFKCRGILGDSNKTFLEAKDISEDARTNYLTMKDMAAILEDLRITLLLR